MVLDETFNEILQKLTENSKIVGIEAIKLLFKIATNILKDPSNPKLRTLRKNNDKVFTKILSVKGGVECLKLIGFQEDSNNFTLHKNTPLINLDRFREAVLTWRDLERDLYISPRTKPKKLFSNPFLKRIENYSDAVFQYEREDNQERARKLIPLARLEQNAQIRMRNIQKLIKSNKLKDAEISLQDVLILELLRWFKEEFFSWVDSPSCTKCNGVTKFSNMDTGTEVTLFTTRVEIHKCTSCGELTPFPRYDDVKILLETRRGRCGEWANTFTLFCRAMGWDSRFVVDEGDHVWTEVYSVTQKRWLHCDPCENICDTPLVYESGWRKQISYVIAYSAEEVQDVTWRYSSNHAEVLKRRKNCSESELLDALFKLRAMLQEDLTVARKKYLTKRSLDELVEFLTEKKPANDEQQGRSSGSLAWRLSRDEIQVGGQSSFTWGIKCAEIVDNPVIIRYSASSDKYEYIAGDKTMLEINEWHKGVFECTGVFRKEEKDWKMVYLARRGGEELGVISWKIQLTDSTKCIDSIALHFSSTTYANGIVKVEICSGDKIVLLKNDENIFKTNEFSGSSSLTIKATLSGGTGDIAWQHAQLFRQPSDCNDFPFNLTMILK